MRDIIIGMKITKWSEVAKLMLSKYAIQGRTGKQCRERYSWGDAGGIISSIPTSTSRLGQRNKNGDCLNSTNNMATSGLALPNNCQDAATTLSRTTSTQPSDEGWGGWTSLLLTSESNWNLDRLSQHCCTKSSNYRGSLVPRSSLRTISSSEDASR